MADEGALNAIESIDAGILRRAGIKAVAAELDPRQILLDEGVEIPEGATITFEVSIEEDPSGQPNALGKPPKKRCTKWCIEVPKKAAVCRTVCEWY